MLRLFIFLLFMSASTAMAAQVPDLNEMTSPANSDELYVIDKSDTTDGGSGTGKRIELQTLYDGAISYIQGLGHLFMTSAERTKLTGVETNATADQTGAEIKALYEAESDTNTFTDAEQTKLSNLPATITESFIIPASAESGDLATGTGVVTFRMPYSFTVTGVRASVTTAPTDAAISVDINEGGVSILSTALTIDATEKTSTTAATAAVISDASLADDAEITIDIDAVGSTVAGEALKVTLIGYQ